MEILACVQAHRVLPLHLHEVTAAHGIRHAVVGAGSQHVENRLVLFLLGPCLRLGQAVLLALGDDGVDVAVCLHGLVILLPALDLVKELEADPQGIGLVGIAVHLVVSVGVGHNILAHLCHPRFHGAGHGDGDGAGLICHLDGPYGLRRRL